MNELDLTPEEHAVLLEVADANLDYFPEGDPEYDTLIGGDRSELVDLRARLAAVESRDHGAVRFRVEPGDLRLLDAILGEATLNFRPTWRTPTSEATAEALFDRVKAVR